MEINLKQAISMFFSQSSFDMVYLEAVANALDAGASKIHIHFSVSTLSNIKSFRLTISDMVLVLLMSDIQNFVAFWKLTKTTKHIVALGDWFTCSTLIM